MLPPLFRQPFFNRNVFEVKIEIDAPILPCARLSFSVNAAGRVVTRLQIKIVKRKQFPGDEQMRTAQSQIRNQRHLQSSAARLIVEVAPMRRDYEVGTEESAFLPTEMPGHIGRIRFDMLEINTLREENVEPGFGGAWLRIRRVGLDFDFA